MEERKNKMSLATFIIILGMLIIVVLGCIIYGLYSDKKATNEKIEELKAQISSYEKQTDNNNAKIDENNVAKETTKNSSENNKTNTNVTTKIDWEEYPSNDNWMEDVIKSHLDSNSVMYKLMRNTLYSLDRIKEISFQNMYYNIIGIGDSTEIVDFNSNYARYCYPNNKNNDLSAKYTNKIQYSIAEFNESYYDGYYDLKTLVKRQYDKLNEEKAPVNNYYYKIPNMLIMNGNNESKEDYENNSRAKTIKVTINGEKEYIFNVKDTNKVQVFDINYTQNTIEKPVEMVVEVLESYNGNKTNDVYISDIQFGITSNIPQGR